MNYCIRHMKEMEPDLLATKGLSSNPEGFRRLHRSGTKLGKD